ncbi:DUF5348 domain-containing protein [Siminovitchia sediminis]|uniref:DUF5348 domain-containing protein n=1 Tax=Siminovitchia sediminis TaxID=1274353 RepID=A0ABW4KJY2_9BACI
MNKSSMYYDRQEEQWYVHLRGNDYALQCGESFGLYIGQKSIPCRLELGNKWYVVMEDVRFDLREDNKYQIKM